MVTHSLYDIVGETKNPNSVAKCRV